MQHAVTTTLKNGMTFQRAYPSDRFADAQKVFDRQASKRCVASVVWTSAYGTVRATYTAPNA